MDHDRLARIRTWLGDAGVELGADMAVGSPFPGATTATVLPLTGVAGGPGPVVKIYDRGIDGVGPDDVRRDATAMRAAEAAGIVAPRLVAADPDGARLGHPAIVMTRLPGAPRATGGADPDGWAEGLADVLIAIAGAPAPEGIDLPAWEPWFSLPVAVPEWAADPGPWKAAEEILAEPLPCGPHRFIHRDFHHLNVHWDGATPVGTVDWVNGCVGPIESDLGSARINIALAEDGVAGFAHADRFLDRCRAAGLPWHPAWDLDMIVGVADRTSPFLVARAWGAAITEPGVRRTLDEMLRRAVAAC